MPHRLKLILCQVPILVILFFFSSTSFADYQPSNEPGTISGLSDTSCAEAWKFGLVTGEKSEVLTEPNQTGWVFGKVWEAELYSFSTQFYVQKNTRKNTRDSRIQLCFDIDTSGVMPMYISIFIDGEENGVGFHPDFSGKFLCTFILKDSMFDQFHTIDFVFRGEGDSYVGMNIRFYEYLIEQEVTFISHAPEPASLFVLGCGLITLPLRRLFRVGNRK
ncbi:MAG: hypothetical protein FWC43_05730 [Planctomycetaceae bacterium]|nr:hypothetical protein [Planctomycetaceae bacterium]